MKLWRVLYGAILTGLVAIALIAGAMNANILAAQAIESLKSTFLYAMPIQFGIIAVFSVIERMVPAAGPRKPIRGYILNFEVTLLNRIVTALSGGMIGAFTVALGSRLRLGWIDLRFSTGHSIGCLILALLLFNFIFNFFYYWMHRFQHESRFLWQEHKLHHMDEHLCALIRESPLEPILIVIATVIPLVLIFKLDPIEGAIGSSVPFVWGVFIHSNIRVPLGWANVFFGGPQMHRIHHSRVREHFDKNYAAMFPIWDILFGTYHHPKHDEYPATGVYDETEVEGVMAAVTLPFRGWRRMFREWRHRRTVTSV